MYLVDRVNNRISRLTRKSFGELALRERDHLQEWLVHQPDALGEELLVIQKEFDGFDETRERLDLLALDKDGNLVVIENKLDDSGRDVTWQALKYTAYVSTLRTSQIVDIYQQYLNRHEDGGSAGDRICEFLAVDELDDISLNAGNGQRMIFIAANFRKEVTSTALWLVNRGIRVQCFRVSPFVFGDEILLDLQQIIPPREAAEYMISLASKEADEATSSEGQKRRHDLRVEFWGLVLQRLAADKVKLFANLSPTTGNWLWARTGISQVQYELAFTQREARVALVLQRKEKSENKRLFDLLEQRKDMIETAFGAPLNWLRKDHLIQCQIFTAQAFDGFNRDEWPAMASWLSNGVQRLEAAFRDPLAELSTLMLIRTDPPEQP